MASWRDTASQQAQDDLDGLLNSALPFAQGMLDQHGEFFPYAVALGLAGDTRMIAADPALGERPPSSEVLVALQQGLRSESETVRAVALVSDVRTQESDTVRIDLEHSEGAAMAVLLPYKKRRWRRGVDYGQPMATTTERTIWS